MERPTGVTILGVLCLIGAGILAIGGIVMIAGGAMLSGMGKSGAGALFAMGGAVVGVIFFVLAALYVLTGIGLLKLQNWARILTIVLIALGLLSAAAGLMTSVLHMSPFLLVRQIIVVAIDVWILIYLFKPHVKQAFGATSF